MGGIAKYLLFLTGGGGWSVKGQKHHYVIKKWTLIFFTQNVSSNCDFNLAATL